MVLMIICAPYANQHQLRPLRVTPVRALFALLLTVSLALSRVLCVWLAANLHLAAPERASAYPIASIYSPIYWRRSALPCGPFALPSLSPLRAAALSPQPSE